MWYAKTITQHGYKKISPRAPQLSVGLSRPFVPLLLKYLYLCTNFAGLLALEEHSLRIQYVYILLRSGLTRRIKAELLSCTTLKVFQAKALSRCIWFVAAGLTAAT